MNKTAKCLGISLLILSTVSVAEDNESLRISVQQGQLGAGGVAQEYQVMNGESFFISVSGSASQPPASVQPPTVQDIRAEQLAQQIQEKVTQLQKKTYDLNSELYIVQRAPLELERQELERQLITLQQQQTQFDAQKTMNAIQQKRIGAIQATAAPTVASGVTVKPVLMDNQEVQLQVSGGDNQATLKTKLGTWTQLPGVQPETWVQVNVP